MSLYQKIKDRTLNFISYKARTEYEVTDKIKLLCSKFELSSNDTDELVEKLLGELRDIDLVNDGNYTKDYIEECSRKRTPPSRIKISQYLYRKGISKDIVASYMSRYSSEDELKAITSHISKIQKLYPNILRQKLFSKLVNKGYSLDLIKQTIDYNDNLN